MMTIARFNCPFYVAAVAVSLASLTGLFLLPGLALKLVCGLAFTVAIYFFFSSLSVSHLVYDRSDLYRWGWLERALHGANRRQAISCHSGFDDDSAELREKFGDMQWQILDHFHKEQMTEPSVRRARAMFPPTPDTLSSRYDAWPVAAESANLVLGLLAIHELRTEAERSAWFKESRRCLRKGGRVVLVEHVRDVAD